MNALEESTNERVIDLCDRRVAGLLSEEEYRNHRRQYLEQIHDQVQLIPMIEVESRWALSQPPMLAILLGVAVVSVYATYAFMPPATSWIFR